MATSKWQPSPILIGTETGRISMYEPEPLKASAKLVSLPQTVASPLEVLSRARQLIASGWVKHTLAVDEHGTGVAPESERAVKWCVIGSFKAAIHYEPDQLVPHGYMEKYLSSLWNTANLNYMIDIKHGEIPVVNDYKIQTQEQIVRLFDKTISLVQKQPQLNKWEPK